MKFPTKSIGGALLGAICILAPTQAYAGEEFRIKNCSNHTFSVDIAMADWFKDSHKNLARHGDVTLHCISSKCNIGITWGANDDEPGMFFEHLYTNLHHGDYVLQLKTAKSIQPLPSIYCIKAFALKKGKSCDIFDDDFDEYDKLSSVLGSIPRCH